MDNRNDVKEFLTTRRAKVSPEQAGLPNYGEHRRVPGLRREEVALLAGVSVDYYTRLERGNLGGVSEDVLEALSRALQLDEAERAHLFDLARGASNVTSPRRKSAQHVRPSVQRILDAMTDAPAAIRNGRMDLLAFNPLGRALYSEVLTEITQPPNSARFFFLNPRSRDYYVDWEATANDVVAVLRAEAGRDPHDRALIDLIGELSTRSDEFRKRWAAHNVKFHRTGRKNLHHPVVGDLELTYEAFELPADGLVMLTYSAEPATPTADALKLLASWAATPESLSEMPVAETDRGEG